MKKFKIHGQLGRKVGRYWKLHVSSLAEGIEAIKANNPDFEYLLFKQRKKGIEYAIRDDATQQFMDKDDLRLRNKEDQFVHIVPIPQGGVAMALGFVSTGIQSFVGEFLLQTLKPDEAKPGKKIETHSYFINGGQNVEKQGGVVPLAYGRLKIGSKVISAAALNYDFNYEESQIYKSDYTEDGFLGSSQQLIDVRGKKTTADYDCGRPVGGTTVVGLRPPGERVTNAMIGQVSSIAPPGEPTCDVRMRRAAGSLPGQNAPLPSLDAPTSVNNPDGSIVDSSLTKEERQVRNKLLAENCGTVVDGVCQGPTFQDRINQMLEKLSDPKPNGDANPSAPTFPAPMSERRSLLTSNKIQIALSLLTDNLVSYQGLDYGQTTANPIPFPYSWAAGLGEELMGLVDVYLRSFDYKLLEKASGSVGQYNTNPRDYCPGPKCNTATKARKAAWKALADQTLDFLVGTSGGLSNTLGETTNILNLAILESKLHRLNSLLDREKNQKGTLKSDLENSNYQIDGEDAKPNTQTWSDTTKDGKYSNIKKVVISQNEVENQLLPGGARWNVDKTRYQSTLESGKMKLTFADKSITFTESGFEVGTDIKIILLDNNKPATVGKSKFYKGDGFHKLESVGIYRVLDLICEGPIEGFVDKNGRVHEYNREITDGKGNKIMGALSTRKDEESEPEIKDVGTNWAKGVYLNDIPVKETYNNKFNVSDFDFDVAYYDNNNENGRITSAGNTTNVPPKDSFLIGGQTQGLLKKEYQNTCTVFKKDTVLYGPANKNFNFEAEPEAMLQNMDYFVSHTVKNPLVNKVVLSFGIPKLFYVFEGQKEAVKLNLTPLVLGLLAALGTYFFLRYLIKKQAIVPSIPRATPYPGGLAHYGRHRHNHAIIDPQQAPSAQKFSQETLIMLAGVAAFAIGGLVAYIAWDKEWDWLSIDVGEKIENSGETWPLGLQWLIQYGRAGQLERSAAISVAGVATSAYNKDIVLDLPMPNPDDRRSVDRQLKIARITPFDNPILEGENAARRNRELKLTSVTEVSSIKLNYPNSVIFGSRINGREFTSVPKRTYDLKLKRVAIPNNYNPSRRECRGNWNGLFLGQDEINGAIGERDLRWTDNPAWCLYDLMQNERFGLGRFGVKREHIDKWNLYAIAKHCDEIVESGFSPKYSLRAFKVVDNGKVKITDTSVNMGKEFGDGSDNNTVGRKLAIFYANGAKASHSILDVDIGKRLVTVHGKIITDPSNSITGTCAVEYDYPIVEPRFTCNAYIETAEEANKLMQQFAKIFNAITYWSAGSVFFAQDKQKDPVMIFTNANVSDAEGFVYSSTKKSERFTACRVKYVDKFDNFKPRVEYVEDPEAINKHGIIDTEIDGFGITSTGQAYRAGRYLIANSQLETELIYFSTKMEGVYLRPGDVFNVMDSLKTNHRYGGNIKKIAKKGSSKTLGHLELDFPIHSIARTAESESWLRMFCFNPRGNQTLESLDLTGGASFGTIAELRESQINEFIVKEANDNSLKVLVRENPYRVVFGEFGNYQTMDQSGTLSAKNDAANMGYSLANPTTTEQKTILKMVANGKKLRIAGKKIINRDGKIESGVSNDEEVDGYAYEIKAGEALTNLKSGYVWVVENKDVGTDTEFKQFRVAAITEEREGTYKIAGMRYVDSKYNHLEKNLGLQKTYNGPPITVPAPNPPENVVCSVADKGLSLTVEWDQVAAAHSYRVKIYQDEVNIKTLEIKRTPGTPRAGYSLDIASYITVGQAYNFSAVVYSIA